jgi:hypothetical protein
MMMKTLRHLKFKILFLIGALTLGACISPSVAPSAQPTLRPILAATVTPISDISTKEPISTSSSAAEDLARYTNLWTRYRDSIYDISFEYPSIYTEKPYKGMCEPVNTLDGVDFGETNEVFVRQQQNLSLEEFVQTFLPTYFPNRQVKIESQEAVQIDDRSAIVLEYRLDGGTENRVFVFIADPKRELIFTFSYIGGSSCDVPEIAVSEKSVFQHAVDTFQVER